MAEAIRSWTLGDLAAAIGGDLTGDASIAIERPVPAGSTDPAGITFAESEKYLAKALSGEVAAIIVPSVTPEVAVAAIRHPKPRQAFGQVLAMFRRPLPLSDGVHSSAVIDPTAQVAGTAKIGPFVTIASGARVGERVQVFANAYVGENCSVGDDSVLYPGVVLYQDVLVGQACILHAGVVLGADGFGFQWTGEAHFKVPQVGRVVLGDRVEIGANSCIDRATCGDTIVADGVKIDNLVQIGHNVAIGEHTVIASQVGLSGSSSVGARVTIGGQTGVSDHVSITDDVTLGGRTGVISEIGEAGAYQGFPAVPIGQAMRSLSAQSRLHEVVARVRALEKEVERLKNDN